MKIVFAGAFDKKHLDGLVCMVGHARRSNPSHKFVHDRIAAGQFDAQQMDVRISFFRRRTMNAKSEARSCIDYLLWRHATHAIDPFAHQAEPIVKADAVERQFV